MKDIFVTRDKEFLYFAKYKKINGCEEYKLQPPEIRYDLKKLQMQQLRDYKFRENQWINVNKAYKYFEDHSVHNLKSNDTKFVELIVAAKELNDNCKSLSTFISRLADSLVGEGYIAEGISYEHTSYRSSYGYRSSRKKCIITKPLSYYDKHMIQLLKTAQIIERDPTERYSNSQPFTVSVDFEMRYVNNKVLYDKIANVVSMLGLSGNQTKSLLTILERRPGDIIQLVNEYKYDIKALFSYIFNYLQPFENVQPDEGIELLKDYYRMGYDIGRELKRYPKYLKSMHDIIMANYKAHKQEYDELKFERLMKPELEYTNHKYCMIIPHCSKDVIAEGTNLNHCVSSYVNKIINGETYIMFMRMIGLEESSLVTIELKDGKITQAKGSYNRALVKEEREFLEEYCQKKKIELKVEA